MRKTNLLIRLLTSMLLCLGLSQSQAANITVSTAIDNVTGSLRSAITTAASGDTISFNGSITSLTPIILLNGEILIDKSLFIQGNGIVSTLIVGSNNRIFNISNAGSVTLSNLSIGNGSTATNGGAIFSSNTKLTLDNCVLARNTATVNGGAIYHSGDTLSVMACQIVSNTASGNAGTEGGAGIFNDGGVVIINNNTVFRGNTANGTSGSGGAIFNSTNATLTVINSRIVSNTSMRAGGGIEDNAGAMGMVTLMNVTLDSNATSMSPGNGGGFHITGAGNASITGGSASFNTASAEGGALWNGSGTMTIDGTVIDGNVASGAGSDQGGGGIYNQRGTVNISNNTVIRFNSADGAAGSGGGILNDAGGTLTVTGSRITTNSAMRAGGGIEDNSGAMGMVTLTNVQLNNNTTSMSPGNGGGLHVTGAGTVNVTRGTANGNTASAEGGAFWNGSGTMTIDGTIIENNTASGAGADQGGGGIYNLSGTLMITNNTIIRGNTADGAAGSGGGILNDVGATLTVMNSRIVSNTSMRAGGGIEDNAGAMGMVTLMNVTLDSNATSMSPGNGGGFHITGAGNASITGGSASFNTASAEGGALWNGSGTMTIDGTVIDGNVASGAGSDQGGGGIYNQRGTVNISNNTVIRFNSADGAAGSGGGILNDAGGTLTVTGSRITTNSAMRAGGGIEDNSGAMGMVTLTNVQLNNNTTSMSPGNGGGLHVTGAGTVNVTRGTANGNTASAEGGAFWNGSGTMTIDGTIIENNTASGAGADQGGGGIYNLSGTLMITNNTIIRGNTADGAAGSGGGILNDVGATLTVMNSRIVSNTSMRAGGGIEDNAGAMGMVTLMNVTLDSNATSMSPGNGGGFHITGAGNASITGGSASFNTASNQGGALWNGSGSMSIDRVSIMKNTVSGTVSTSGGAGVYNKGGAITITASTIAENACTGANATGGAIFNTGTGRVDLVYSTVSGNTVTGLGGGISSEGALSIQSATIANNTAGQQGGGVVLLTMDAEATISSSIIAMNTAATGADLDADAGTYTSGGYNVVGQDDANVFTAMSTDQEGTAQSMIDPMLEPLADNGGDTETHALMGGSPAIDAGDPMDMANDQRDSTVFNGRRDAGSYESQKRTTSIDVADRNSIQNAIFPNPTTFNFVAVELNPAFGTRATVTIINLASGKIALSTKITASNNTIAVNALPAGTYAVQLRNDGKAESHKLIILK